MCEKDIDKNKFSVSFKNTPEEQELKKWILEQAGIVGFNKYTKQTMYLKMVEEKKNKTSK